MRNVLPSVVPLIGVIGLSFGLFGSGITKAFYKRQSDNLIARLGSPEVAREGTSLGSFFGRAAPVVSGFQQVVLTLAGWLGLFVGVVCMVAYLVGFWGINLFELLPR